MQAANVNDGRPPDVLMIGGGRLLQAAAPTAPAHAARGGRLQSE